MDNPRVQSPAEPLTEREREILRLLANGLSDADIADALVLTVGTVKWYNRQIYGKLNARNRAQAALIAEQTGLLARSSAPQSTPAPRQTLPARVTSFVGRERETAELRRLLETSRLVTLTGPPGTGKTRLALEVAAGVSNRFPDGAHFVSLAPLRESQHVAHAMAQVLGIKEPGGESLISTLKTALRERNLLLVLDNFEHLLDAAPLVSELLAAAPGLTALVTSRERLGLYGEHEFPVPPLQLPDATHDDPAALRTYESVDLFVQRASAASPGFTLDASNAAAIAAICVQVDGLPLAIELAAARAKFYAPQTLLVRLGSRLQALRDGPRDLPARQQTLRATLAWSYDLLTDAEKVLFARLGVFAGGCTLMDAEAVCGDDALDVAGGLESLVNKSLLRQDSGDEPRFVMLETMREYALDLLSRSGEYEAMADRHTTYFRAMAEVAKDHWFTGQETQWVNRLDAEHDNLRAALRRTIQTDTDAQRSLAFAAALSRLWRIKGYFVEGRAWLDEALSLPGAAASTLPRANALRGEAMITYLQSDLATTQHLYEEALSIHRALGQARLEAEALLGLGEVATEIGDFEAAMLLFERAYTIFDGAGDAYGCAAALTQLGWGELRPGNLRAARGYLEQALARHEEQEYAVGISLVLSGLGEVALRLGELDEAEAFLQRSLHMRRETKEQWGMGASLGSLAWVAMRRGDAAGAMGYLAESLTIRRGIGDRGGMAWCLEKMAELAREQGDDPRAVRLYGAAAALRASVNSAIDPADQPAYDAMRAALRAALPPDIYDALWSEGARMPLDSIIAYALA